MTEHVLPSSDRFAERRLLAGPAATRRLGRAIAERLAGGEVLLLHGPLGAGKTFLVQAICEALGVDEEVTSPTFTLVNRYVGRLVVYHLDFYRVDAAADLDDIGVEAILDEVAGGEAVLVAEWAERLAPLAGAHLEWLILPADGPEDREWHLRGVPALPDRWSGLLARVADGEEGASCSS